MSLFGTAVTSTSPRLKVMFTFLRDNETKRPRINKPDSRLDREQKSKGEYYYAID